MTTATMSKFTVTEVLSKFVRGIRKDNGVSYWHLVDDCPQEIKDLVRELHDDELPNDWRYDTIVNILFDMKHRNSVNGDIGVDVYSTDLVKWINLTRLGLIDELIDDGMIDPRVNYRIESQIKVAQYHATERMIDQLFNYFGMDRD